MIFTALEYDWDAFPRLKFLQTRLRDVKAFTGPELLQSPHIRFVCNKEFASNLKDYSGQFSVNGLTGKCVQSKNNKLILTVCIFDIDDSGNRIPKASIK